MDICRCTLLCSDPFQMAACVEFFRQSAGFEMVRCANRFEGWTQGAALRYRNVNTNVAAEFSVGGETVRFICEIQLHFRDFYAIGKQCHAMYQVLRAQPEELRTTRKFGPSA